MSDTKHTPGPWYWDGDVTNYDPEQEAPWLIGADSQPVLRGEIHCDRANADLIAAAPALLEALRYAMQVFDPNRCPSRGEQLDVYNKIRTAIANATGAT